MNSSPLTSMSLCRQTTMEGHHLLSSQDYWETYPHSIQFRALEICSHHTFWVLCTLCGCLPLSHLYRTTYKQYRNTLVQSEEVAGEKPDNSKVRAQPNAVEHFKALFSDPQFVVDDTYCNRVGTSAHSLFEHHVQKWWKLLVEAFTQPLGTGM